jgi:hypothetical protein
MFTRIISKIPMLNLRKLNFQSKNKYLLLNKENEQEKENFIIRFIKNFFNKKKNVRFDNGCV